MNPARRPLTAVVVIGALAAAGVAATAPGAQASTRRNVPHTKPAWVAKTPSKGKAAAGKKTDLKVYLQPDGGIDALKAQVAKISAPGSAQYHQFLTAAQYHRQFDATAATVKQVRSYLTSNHLKVTKVEAHHRYLAVRGTNANISKAFGVTLKKFNHQGHAVQANTDAVSVPSAIASNLLAVTGLDTTPHKASTQTDVGNGPDAAPSAGFRNARPCSTFYGQVLATYQADFKTPLPKFQGKTLPYAVCGYTGPQLRSAYTGNSTLTGAGVTVAITDAYASPTIAKDANTYATNHGDGAYQPGQLTQAKPSRGYNRQADCGPSGWYGEETLDVEAVHAMAPDANIAYYPSASCYDDDFLATLQTVVDDDTASVVTNSWSDIEANESADNINAYEQVFMQGAMQGITFSFSSGDSGDEVAATGLKTVGYPSSDPYVVGVGGTSDAIDGTGAFQFQTGWGTVKWNLTPSNTWSSIGFTSGAGGGFSNLFNKPDYQAGVTPGAYRGVPDIALDADPNTGFLMGQTQTFPDGVYYDEYRIGGTSLASPLFAGMQALAQQNAKTRFGFMNPALYKLLGTTSYNDVPSGKADVGNVRVDFANSVDATDGLLYSVRQFNQDSSLTTGKGWDDVTGVGSPNATWLTTIQ